jgi:hypothetical protein
MSLVETSARMRRNWSCDSGTTSSIGCDCTYLQPTAPTKEGQPSQAALIAHARQCRLARCAAQWRSVRKGSSEEGSARLCFATHRSARLGKARQGSARLGKARQGWAATGRQSAARTATVSADCIVDAVQSVRTKPIRLCSRTERQRRRLKGLGRSVAGEPSKP